jgi:hypothetical protein
VECPALGQIFFIIYMLKKCTQIRKYANGRRVQGATNSGWPQPFFWHRVRLCKHVHSFARNSRTNFASLNPPGDSFLNRPHACYILSNQKSQFGSILCALAIGRRWNILANWSFLLPDVTF